MKAEGRPADGIGEQRWGAWRHPPICAAPGTFDVGLPCSIIPRVNSEDKGV